MIMYIYYFILYLHSNGGGGGERVLWMIVASILQDSTISKNVSIIIYSGDITMSALDCLQGVKVM
jgi:hypothetical protein